MLLWLKFNQNFEKAPLFFHSFTWLLFHKLQGDENFALPFCLVLDTLGNIPFLGTTFYYLKSIYITLNIWKIIAKKTKAMLGVFGKLYFIETTTSFLVIWSRAVPQQQEKEGGESAFLPPEQQRSGNQRGLTCGPPYDTGHAKLHQLQPSGPVVRDEARCNPINIWRATDNLR